MNTPKFGINILTSIDKALALKRENGNGLWQEAYRKISFKSASHTLF
jgi:hypothetical protein